MLLDFIVAQRATIIAITRERVARRFAPIPTAEELLTGVPLFLDQLADSLRNPRDPGDPAIASGAAAHGARLLQRGYTVAQVVHDYGDICQAVTELAESTRTPITTDEFHTLNLCLDNAIAEALTEYTRLRDRSMAEGETERSGVLAHELRNRIAAAQLAFLAIKSGRAPIGGSVAAVVLRNLSGMAGLIHRSLVEVRIDAGSTCRRRVLLHEIFAESEVDGNLEANLRGVTLHVEPVDPALAIDADPEILAGVLANLLQNGFKFTPVGGKVTLRARAADDRILIEVEDECGGLPPGKSNELFDAFAQRGRDRGGLGLGLFISRKGVEANGGILRVRNAGTHGCVFTVDLPLPPAAS